MGTSLEALSITCAGRESVTYRWFVQNCWIGSTISCSRTGGDARIARARRWRPRDCAGLYRKSVLGWRGLCVDARCPWRRRLATWNCRSGLATAAVVFWPAPTYLAAVQRPAIGLGATVALMCDVVVAARSVKLADAHVKVGLVAGAGGHRGLQGRPRRQLRRSMRPTWRSQQLVTYRSAWANSCRTTSRAYRQPFLAQPLTPPPRPGTTVLACL